MGTVMKRTGLLFQAVLLAAFSIMALTACGEEEGGSLGESGAGKASHNAGRNCKECHGAQYSGTVYASLNGPVLPNGVIVITQNDGQTLEITADNSGNFYTRRGNPGVGYLATVQGNTLNMASMPTDGGCSKGGCHDGSSYAGVYKN